MTDDAEVFKSSKSVEAYTPREWWERAIAVMGEIDLDPASDPGHSIPARNHYIKRDNGLIHDWNGRIFLNPPYGRNINVWFEKLWTEMVAGRCKEAIVLWKAALETKGTRTLITIPAYKCSAVPNARISFLNGDGTTLKRGTGDVATFTPIFHYFGPNEVKFIQVFMRTCTIWKAVRRVEQITLLK